MNVGLWFVLIYMFYIYTYFDGLKIMLVLFGYVEFWFFFFLFCFHTVLICCGGEPVLLPLCWCNSSLFALTVTMVTLHEDAELFWYICISIVCKNSHGQQRHV